MENFENGGLKHGDISSKITSLQCSGIRKLCDEKFHEWKIISSHFINKYFGKSFKFISIFSLYFSEKGLNFVYQLFDDNGNVKSWSSIKEEFGFNNFSNFKWQQLIYVLLPPFWKKIIKEKKY